MSFIKTKESLSCENISKPKCYITTVLSSSFSGYSFATELQEPWEVRQIFSCSSSYKINSHMTQTQHESWHRQKAFSHICTLAFTTNLLSSIIMTTALKEKSFWPANFPGRTFLSVHKPWSLCNVFINTVLCKTILKHLEAYYSLTSCRCYINDYIQLYLWRLT